jgi:uncharacterized protein involved in cysteine biosynthesis
MKIPPVTTDLFHEDGRTNEQTDITKLFATFRNLRKRRKTEIKIHKIIITISLYFIALNNTSLAMVIYWLTDKIMSTFQYCVFTA